MSDLPTLTIGERVRGARERLELTREDFAREVGTSTSTMARLERHSQLPKVTTLAAIAERIDVSLDVLVGEKASA